MPYGGLAVMRSGWSSEAHYLIMDAAPFGGVHGHEDRLSIEVSVFGRPVIVDPGTYTYNASDSFRSYFTGSHAHNSVLVDGLGQVRRWQPAHMTPHAGIRPAIGWISNDQVDFVQACDDEGYGKYQFQRPNRPEIERTVRHQRSVLFVKPCYWVIVDTMHAEGFHEYQRYFQAAAGIDVELMEHGTRFMGPNDIGMLLMSPVSDPAELTTVRGCEDPIGGWISDGTRNHKQPATQLRQMAKVSGSTSLVTLIYPIRSRQTEVRFTRVALTDGSGLGLCVEGIDGEDRLVFRNDNDPKPEGEDRACVYMAGFRKRNGRTSTLFEIDAQPMKALDPT